MSNDKRDEPRDANRDPLTGTPGSHPVGVAAGGLAGAAAGAVIGSVFGPIGTLVGGAVGTLGGAAGGKAVAERVDPTGEVEYWRDDAPNRDYYNAKADFDRDYAPAYRYGTETRNTGERAWQDVEPTLQQEWDAARGESQLSWDEARPAIRDAYTRTDNTYRAYADTDEAFGTSYVKADYYRDDYDYGDYQSAYRYGTRARSGAAQDARWDDATESRLEQGWDRAKGDSRLGWQDAKAAVRDAWHRVERKLPGDADGDGR